MKFLKYLFLSGSVLALILLFNMKERVGQNSVAFYNVENLFDTINDGSINDEDFLPTGKNSWNTKKYLIKLENLSEVIAELGDSDGPELLGLAEVENSRVLEDLLKTDRLRKLKYHFVHFDSRDRRGIDVALLYKGNYFKPVLAKAFSIPNSESKSYRTRDILFVKGIVKGDTLNLFVTHWPSRLGGKEQSEKHRIHAAKALKNLIDSLCSSSLDNILVMGDFNDEPSDKSLSILGSSKAELINPFKELEKQNLGTIKYKRSWNLFDQILISKGLLDKKGLEYKKQSGDIFDPLWMHYKEEERNGPFRTFIGQKFYGGYSDHFPVYIQLDK